jgi:hypothetical protein
MARGNRFSWEDVRECELGGIMKRSWFVGLALATALAAAPAAKADSTYYFSINGAAVTNPADPNCCAPSISGGGYLTSVPDVGSPGSYDITGSSGVTFSFNGSSYNAILIGNNEDPTSPITVTFYPNFAYYIFPFDDILTPESTPSVDNDGGLLFQITSPGSYFGALIALFSGNATDPAIPGTTYWWDEYLASAPDNGYPLGNGGYGDPLDDFYVSPEPSSFLLLGTGLLGLAAFLYRRRQTGQHWAA